MSQQEDAVSEVARMIKGYVDQESILNFDKDRMAAPASRIEKLCRRATDDSPAPMKGLHDAHEYLEKQVGGSDGLQRRRLIRSALQLLKQQDASQSTPRSVVDSDEDETQRIQEYLGVPAGARR